MLRATKTRRAPWCLECALVATLQLGRWSRPRRQFDHCDVDLRVISIIASNARLASPPPAAFASVNARGVICQDTPQLSLHQPHVGIACSFRAAQFLIWRWQRSPLRATTDREECSVRRGNSPPSYGYRSSDWNDKKMPDSENDRETGATKYPARTGPDPSDAFSQDAAAR